MSTILVATDFSPSAERALEEALHLAKPLGAPIELVHVHPVTSLPVPPTLDVTTRPPGAEEVTRTETALNDWAARVRQAGVPCETYAAFGAPAEEIVRRAGELPARLVVIGTKGHSTLRHLLVGSVAERVVQHARCPVLVVPAPGAP
jgi:nucleotide-binding universal stress UspA family protein